LEEELASKLTLAKLQPEQVTTLKKSHKWHRDWFRCTECPASLD